MKRTSKLQVEITVQDRNGAEEIHFLEPNDSLMEALVAAGVDIGHSCEGMGTCGTCRVFVTENTQVLPERNDVELERANDLQFEQFERLTCQLPIIPGLKIKLPRTQ